MTEPRVSEHTSSRRLPKARVLWIVALFLVELGLLTILYQFHARIECLATEAEMFCRGLRSLVARALSVAALASLLFWARPGLARRFLAMGAEPGGEARRWLSLHLVGVALLLVPLSLAGGADMAPDFTRYAPFWAMGALAAALGGLAWLIPPALWPALAGAERNMILVTVGLGLVLPDLADLALPLWSHWPALTAATFEAVAWTLRLTGLPVYVDAPGYVLGLQNFAVHVAQQCSGVEGMALVSGFVFVYALLFRAHLRWRRYWLVVLPLGLAASWLLNVIRIAVLILLGEYVSPELAVNGFHSFAGTLFFTLLALGLMWVVQATPWLHRHPETRAKPREGLRQDWLAARIVPFILFMLLSSLVSAVFAEAEMGYPVKALGMATALLFFAPALLAQSWAPRSLPIAAGLGVGLLWWALAEPDPQRSAQITALLAGLSSLGLLCWLALRLIGTVVLVPLIEELFFRGYLLGRFAGQGALGRMAALGLSSLAFGVLHDRLIAGALSGVVFGAIYLARQRVSDAVWAHVVANLVVALAALARQDWTLI